MMKSIKFLRRFREDDDGNAAVELLLVIPVLVWALLSTWVYFGAYRAESISTRAGLTIADVISREKSVDGGYLTSMRTLLRELTDAERDPDLRVTLYRYDEPDDRYRVVWSRNRGMGNGNNLTDDDLDALVDRLPIMANLQRALLVETRTKYTAPFSIGLGPFLETNLEDIEFTSFTVISPRNDPSVCFDPSPNNPESGDELC